MAVGVITSVGVTKRGGRKATFKHSAIVNVLRSAQRTAGANLTEPELLSLADEISAAVRAEAAATGEVSSARIAEILTANLSCHPELLEAYTTYSRDRRSREAAAVDTRSNLDRVAAGDKKIMAENGNKDARTFTTQREIIAGAVYKAEGLASLPEDIRRAHIEGMIHIHDLDRSPFSAMPNCSLPDFEYLLKNGFKLGNARIESPRSIGVAATLLVQLLGAISGEQYGGISIHEIDKLLEPYALKNLEKNRELYAEVLDDEDEVEAFARKKTTKDIYDAMQAFEYQVNTLTTSAAQTPFTSVSMGMGTSWASREIQRAVLAVREKGMSGETAIFPKILFFVDEGVNHDEGDPNYDIKLEAMRCSMRRIYPDLISVPRIKELKDGQLITPMGCRSFLHPWKNSRGEYELVGRNNLGVVSLNLPRMATQSEGNIEDFFTRLDQGIDLAFDALKIREDIVLSAKVEAAPVMYTQGGMGDPTGKTTVADFYTGENEKRSSISLGYIGIHNAMTALTGDDHWHADAKWRALSKEILAHLNARVDAAQSRFHSFVSVYSTPSESLCDRFAELDRLRFGRIEGVNDREYYENSFHFPSYQDTNPIAKIHFESHYMNLTSGGFMYYVEAPNLLDNPMAFEAIWNEAYDNVGYFGINSPVDSCFDCGFEGEFSCDEHGYSCPSCGNRDETRASVTRRLCGYLGSPMKRPVVHGKQSEINSRVKHV